VAQLDQVTQQNAALVEQSAAAAESLNAQAKQLLSAVAAFKLTGQDAVATSQPVVQAAAAVRQRNERRGPGRATNVVRPRFKAAPAAAPVTLAKAAIGTDDWTSF
jgi:methyl-accepting chemotaxis protein